MALLYDQAGLHNAHVVCLDGRNAWMLEHNASRSWYFFMRRDRTQKRNAMFKRVTDAYLRSLSMPGHCNFIRWPKKVSIIESLFQNSSYALANELRCRVRARTDVSILPSAYTTDERFPLYRLLKVQAHARHHIGRKPAYSTQCQGPSRHTIRSSSLDSTRGNCLCRVFGDYIDHRAPSWKHGNAMEKLNLRSIWDSWHISGASDAG